MEARLKRVVAETFSLFEQDIGLDSTFEGDLGADSLDMVELSMMVEMEFNISIDDGQWADIETVGHALELIEALPTRMAA